MSQELAATEETDAELAKLRDEVARQKAESEQLIREKQEMARQNAAMARQQELDAIRAAAEEKSRNAIAALERRAMKAEAASAQNVSPLSDLTPPNNLMKMSCRMVNVQAALVANTKEIHEKNQAMSHETFRNTMHTVCAFQQKQLPMLTSQVRHWSLEASFGCICLLWSPQIPSQSMTFRRTGRSLRDREGILHHRGA